MADNTNSASYYIRVRGRILGPYSPAQLKSLRSRGQFGRANEISTDRQTWQSAAVLEELWGAQQAGGKSASRTGAGIEGRASPAANRSVQPVWHYAIGGEECGPVTLLEMRGMVAAGQLVPSDMVWKDGLADWAPLSSVPELQAAARPAMSVAAASNFCFACGTQLDPRAEMCPKCGVRNDHGRTQPAPLRINGQVIKPAGFWKRLAGFMVDSLLLAAVDGLLFWALAAKLASTLETDSEEILAVKGLVLLAYQIGGSIVIWWIYHVSMEASPLQGTLGKLAVAAKVVDLQGRRLSFARASGRYWAKLLSGAILGIGYLMVAFTENKQALHDTMSGCLVVSKY
jgi:uncharacterized RDD family membrane protein YckC